MLPRTRAPHVMRARPRAGDGRVSAGPGSVDLEGDDSVVVAAAPVDDGRSLALLVDVEVEVVTDELHLVEGLVEGHRDRAVGLLADHERTVTGHGDRADLALDD